MRDLIKNFTIGAIVALTDCPTKETTTNTETKPRNQATLHHPKPSQNQGDSWAWSLKEALN